MAANRDNDLILGPEAPLTEATSVPASISLEAQAKADELSAMLAREIAERKAAHARHPGAERSMIGKTFPETGNKLHPENGKATAAHARQPGDPVAWQRLHPTNGWTDCRPEDVAHYRAAGQTVRPLYTAAHPAPPAPVAVPEGDALRKAVTAAYDDARDAASEYITRVGNYGCEEQAYQVGLAIQDRGHVAVSAIPAAPSPASPEGTERMREAPRKPMDYFAQNVDRWGAAEWFDRLCKAVSDMDAAVRSGDDLSVQTYRNIAASSATHLARECRETIREALASLPAEPEGEKAVKVDWVDCPICGEPDMRKETDSDGGVLIHCVNHGCSSNGGATPSHPEGREGA